MRTFFSFAAAFLIADFLGTIVLGAMSTLLLPPGTGRDTIVIVITMVILAAASASILTAVLQFLGANWWLSGLVIAFVGTTAVMLRGASQDDWRIIIEMGGLLFGAFAITSLVISFSYKHTFNKLRGL